jgi:hypothetical protein
MRNKKRKLGSENTRRNQHWTVEPGDYYFRQLEGLADIGELFRIDKRFFEENPQALTFTRPLLACEVGPGKWNKLVDEGRAAAVFIILQDGGSMVKTMFSCSDGKDNFISWRCEGEVRTNDIKDGTGSNTATSAVKVPFWWPKVAKCGISSLI